MLTCGVNNAYRQKLNYLIYDLIIRFSKIKIPRDYTFIYTNNNIKSLMAEKCIRFKS